MLKTPFFFIISKNEKSQKQKKLTPLGNCINLLCDISATNKQGHNSNADALAAFSLCSMCAAACAASDGSILTPTQTVPLTRIVLTFLDFFSPSSFFFF